MMHNWKLGVRNPTKWLGEMPKRVLPERQPAVAKPSALDPIALMHNAQYTIHNWLRMN